MVFWPLRILILSSQKMISDDDLLLAKLGIEVESPPITELRHVRSVAEKRAAEEIANRNALRGLRGVQAAF